MQAEDADANMFTSTTCEHPINGTWNELNGGSLEFRSDCSGRNYMCSTNFIYQNPGVNNQLNVYTTQDSVSAGCADSGQISQCIYSIQPANGDLPERLILNCGTGMQVFNRASGAGAIE